MKKQNKTTLAKASIKAEVNHQAATTALTVRLNEIVFPKGVETLGQKANFLHCYSVEASKRANGAAIMAGWVLSVARSTCAHGQWMTWLEQNVSFSHTTATNYMNLYAVTLGKARANARRPIALSVEPTVAELEAAAHDVDSKALSALYKSTRLMSMPPKWGGANRGQGRKPAAPLPTPSAAENAKAIWAEVMKVIEKKTVASAVALLDERTTEVCWGAVLELYEALKDHRSEFKRG